MTKDENDIIIHAERQKQGALLAQGHMLYPFEILIIFLFTYPMIEPLFDTMLKEKFLKPWKGVLCFHFSVYACACELATEHTCLPRNLILENTYFTFKQNRETLWINMKI